LAGLPEMVWARVEVLARHAAILFVDLVTVEARAINGTQTFQSVRPAGILPAASSAPLSGVKLRWAHRPLDLCSSAKAL
jgi:hypothetical protein